MSEAQKTLSLADHLKVIKEVSGMTYQEIADTSNVPIQTVKRVFSGGSDSPSYPTIVSIVKAMGGSLDRMEGILPHTSEPPKIEDPVLQRIESANAAIVAVLQKRLQDHKISIRRSQKWLLRLFITCIVLVVFIVIILTIDIVVPDIGFIRK